MRSLYIILSVIGWIWTAVFFIALWLNARRRKAREGAKGLEVITHE